VNFECRIRKSHQSTRMCECRLNRATLDLSRNVELHSPRVCHLRRYRTSGTTSQDATFFTILQIVTRLLWLSER
jgi:hypothetical protein